MLVPQVMCVGRRLTVAEERTLTGFAIVERVELLEKGDGVVQVHLGGSEEAHHLVQVDSPGSLGRRGRRPRSTE
jgi:hypothetical protein